MVLAPAGLMTALVCPPRTPQGLRDAVAMVDPEHNVSLQRRDVTGDGKPETFCNVAVRTLLALLEVSIPPMLANDLARWFRTADGWTKLDKPADAQARAELGFPTVGIWTNSTGHGHIVLVVPRPVESDRNQGRGVWTAQAGRENWNCAPIERAGLISDAYTFFTHA